MRLRSLTILLGAALLVGCGSSAPRDTVAQAGKASLSIDRLADLMVNGKGVPVRRDVAQQMANLWVDYAILVERLADGDSLMDSTTIAAAMWPEIEQHVASDFHQKLAGASSTMDSSEVDSVYAAGDLRLIRHILFRTTPDMSPTQKAAKKRQAEAALQRLHAGAPWAKVSQATEEPGGAAREGSLGVISHDDRLVPAFLSAAYQLAPGGLSPVTETQFGYHIISRPSLAEVRDSFRAGVADRLQEERDSVYLSALDARHHLQVQDGAIGAVHDMAGDPVRARESNTVLGTYDGGSFRMSDFARWLEAVSPQAQQQVQQATDDQLRQIIEQFMRNVVLLREAHDSGVTLNPDDWKAVRAEYAGELARAEQAIGLTADSLAALRAQSGAERTAGVERLVDDYLKGLTLNRKPFAPVPPFLADRLRAKSHWMVYPVAIDQTLQRVKTRKQSADSAMQSARPPEMVPKPAPGQDSTTHAP